MFLSVVIPVFNMEKYIERCLESLSRQTDNDFEVILVDDGSTDKSYETAVSYLENSFMNHKVMKKNNQGQSIARNIGMQSAKGEYVLFLDSDDIVSKNLVAECKEAVLEKPDILMFDYKRVDEDGTTRDNKISLNSDDNVSGYEIIKKYRDNEFNMWTSSAIYSREFLKRKKIIFCPEAHAAEDLGFQFKALLSTDNVKIINDVLSYYCQRKESLTNNINIDKNMTVIDAFEDVLKFIEYKEMDVSLEKPVLSEFIPEHIMYQILGYLNEDNAEEVMDILEDKCVHKYLMKAKMRTPRYGKSMVKWIKIAAWSPEKFVNKYLKAVKGEN